MTNSSSNSGCGTLCSLIVIIIWVVVAIKLVIQFPLLLVVIIGVCVWLQPKINKEEKIKNERMTARRVKERFRDTKLYQQARVIILDDDVNTFQHVVDCLRKIIPGMREERAWKLAHQIDSQGSAEVW